MRRNEIQKLFLCLSAAFLITIPVWRYGVVPELEKIPIDYQYEVTSMGPDRIFNPETNQRTEVIAKLDRKDKVTAVYGNVLVIENIFKSTDAITNAPIFEGSGVYGVNRVTGENISGFGDKNRTGLFKFPLHVKKEGYTLWSPEVVETATLAKFEEVEVVKGLETYKFSYYIEPLDKTTFFGGIQGYLIKGDHKGILWVEPITGHIVKLRRSGVNKLLNESTLEEIGNFEVWSQEYTDDTVTNQVHQASYQKQCIHLYEQLIPILLGIIAFAFFITFIISKKLGLPLEE